MINYLPDYNQKGCPIYNILSNMTYFKTFHVIFFTNNSPSQPQPQNQASLQ